MKKNYSVLFVVATIALVLSCSQSQEESLTKSYDNQASKHVMIDDDIIVMGEDGKMPDSEIQKIVSKKPENYQFGNPNSELWQEKSLRAPSLTVSGYDSKVEINTGKTTFAKGYTCDSRIIAFEYYIVKTYQYKKTVQVPKESTISIPPQSIMANYKPMGCVPGTNNVGYSMSNPISDNTHNTYQLISEAREITHNLMGQLIAPLNNPVYLPCNAIKPSDFVFVYQVTDW
ncbi:MAG: hypothetical protein RSA66_11380 [Muribaculaceae bacterium]